MTYKRKASADANGWRPEAKSDVTHKRPAKRNPELRVVQSEDDGGDASIDVVGFRPLLPEGQWYEAKYVDHATAYIFATGKVFLEFEIVAHGDFCGVRLFRAFNARRVFKPFGRQGRFVLAANGDLYGAMVRLQGLKSRADRVTLRPLRNMVFRIKTRTVRTNRDQKSIASHLHYSVITDIETAE